MKWLVALQRRFLPARCPACGRRGLETLNELPELRLSFHQCAGCGEKLKRTYGKWFIPSDEEWRATALKAGRE